MGQVRISIERLAHYVKKIGPVRLFPISAKDIDVRNLCRLKTQGRVNEMYSFQITYSLDRTKYQTALILRMYNYGEEVCRKEFAVLKALKKQNIPVPSVYSIETSNETVGKPFVIMEKILGKSASHLLYSGTSPLLTVEKLAESLAMIHKLDPSCIGHSQLFAEQQEFAQRKLDQARAIIKHKCRTCFPPIRPRRYLEALRRLEKRGIIQRFRPTLIHGDFSPNHVLITKDGPVIIDWEHATVGDPAFDVGFAYHLLMWIGRSQIDHKLVERSATIWTDLRENFVRYYEKYMGHKLANLEFYKELAALEFLLFFDGRLRPGVLSAPPVQLGLQGRLFGAFFVRNRLRPFHDYCVQYLAKNARV